MTAIHTVGIDIAKKVSQLHAVAECGQVVLKRQLPTKELRHFFEELPPCLIGMESSSGANYLARELGAIGHTVKLMPAKYVKPYVKTNKSDANDAEAICEAVNRPNMRFVPIKQLEQQSILTLHRTRTLLIKQKVSVVNSMKSCLTEFGIVVARNISGTKVALQAVADPQEIRLPNSARSALTLLAEQLKATEARILQCEKLIESVYNQSPPCRRLATVPGIGVLAATALVAVVGDGSGFHSGRELSAWLGLVPRQHSSGGRQTHLGISKRGDAYLRQLLVMGAMSIMRSGLKSKYHMVHWAINLATRKRYKIGAVALANKLARIAWAVLTKGQAFNERPQQSRIVRLNGR